MADSAEKRFADFLRGREGPAVDEPRKAISSESILGRSLRIMMSAESAVSSCILSRSPGLGVGLNLPEEGCIVVGRKAVKKQECQGRS